MPLSTEHVLSDEYVLAIGSIPLLNSIVSNECLVSGGKNLKIKYYIRKALVLEPSLSQCPYLLGQTSSLNCFENVVRRESGISLGNT